MPYKFALASWIADLFCKGDVVCQDKWYPIILTIIIGLVIYIIVKEILKKRKK